MLVTTGIATDLYSRQCEDIHHVICQMDNFVPVNQILMVTKKNSEIIKSEDRLDHGQQNKKNVKMLGLFNTFFVVGNLSCNRCGILHEVFGTN